MALSGPHPEGIPIGLRPVLPLRDLVLFPQAPAALIVGRPRSLAALSAAEATADRDLLVLTQRDVALEDPGPDQLYPFGTLARVSKVLKLPDGNCRVVLEGLCRARPTRFELERPHLVAAVQVYPPPPLPEPEAEVFALARTVKATLDRLARLHRALPAELQQAANALEDPDRLADTLVAALSPKTADRQELLEVVDPAARLERIYRALLSEIEYLEVEKKLKSRVRRERENVSRDQWLQEQVRQTQKELGDKETRSDLDELVAALAEKPMPADVRDRTEREVRKLAQMNALSAEATVVRNYLDWILALPWVHEDHPLPELDQARAVLQADHYGLQKVKRRVLEALAVRKLVGAARGPVLCLVGPPGVGKTSLARSVARALQRPFVKVALGGVRDEAEIRGHRRTYIGALPGRLIQALKRAGRTDPVILLDEIDKLSSDYRGDPSSALLEVLDPEQNHAFSDHYLDLDYDLSEVTFLCTANAVDGIPGPLLDRLELIEVPSYTEAEKVSIARRYLLPRQIQANGLTPEQLTLGPNALLEIIRRYTREAGVRELERLLARLARRAALRTVREGKPAQVKAHPHNLERLLGAPRVRPALREDAPQVGLVRGLAVTPWGGEVLPIEVAVLPGKGQVQLTGRLGDWLKESANAGITALRARAEPLKLPAAFPAEVDLHVHYPGNPLRTDGPSAGLAMALALWSALVQVPLPSDFAVTGEISLRGRVLAIGGVAEKVLAAWRFGLRRVILPGANRRDLQDLPQNVLQTMTIIAVDDFDQALAHLFPQPGAS